MTSTPEIACTLDMAEIRRISFDQLLSRIEKLWNDELASQVVYRACHESLSHNQILALAESVRRMADAAENLASPARLKALSAVTGPIAEPWLTHRYRFRRELAYRIFRGTGVAAEAGRRLLCAFHRSGDQE